MALQLNGDGSILGVTHIDNVPGADVKITPVGNFASTDVQAMVSELSATSGSNKIGYDGGTVQDVLDAMTGQNGAASVGYTPAGAGAVATTVASELRKTVTPENFGAVGDGIADDRTALYNALYHACSTGTRFMGGAGKTYKIDTEIIIDRSNMPPVIIDWNGAGVICNGAGISFTGQPSFLTTSLTVEPLRNDAKLTLASVLGIQQGDLIEIESPAITQGAVNTLHYYLVSELDGNDVYIEGVVVADINQQQIINSGKTGQIVVRAYHLNKKLTMMNGSFSVVDTTGSLTALLISKNYMTVVDNMEFDGHCRNQLYIQYNGHDIVSRIRVRDMGYINKDVGYLNLPSSPGGLSFGYGVIHARNYSSLVRDLVAGHGWHATDASRGQMHIIYDRVVAGRNGYGCSTHEGSWYVSWKNCSFRGKQGVIASRCAYPSVENCEFTDIQTNGVSYGQQNLEVTIKNNRFLNQNPDVSAAGSAVYKDSASGEPGPGSISSGSRRAFILDGNYISGYGRIYAGYDTSSNKTGDCIVKNNFISRGSFQGVACLTNTVISDNTINLCQGQVAFNIVNVDSSVTMLVANNNENGGFSTPSNAALAYVTGSQSPGLSVFSNNSTTGGLVRAMSASMVFDVISGNVCRDRVMLGTTVTIKNKVNNLQGLADIGATITTNVNNTTMTL